MSQTDRLAFIARLLENGQTVTTQSLRDRFEVSRATVMRDVAFLRDRNSMPVAYDPQERAFKIVRSSRFAEDVVAIPGLWLTQDEAYALLTLFNITRQLDPGIISGFVEPLRRPIKRVLGDAGYKMLGIDHKVRIEIAKEDCLPADQIAVLRSALLNDKAIYLEAQIENGLNFRGVCFPLAFVLTVKGWFVEVMQDIATACEVIPIPLKSIQLAQVPSTDRA